jgi:hypothetical protein
MLSPGRRSSPVEQVVIQRLNLVFGTSKPVTKETVTTEQKFFHITSELDLVWWWKKKSERFAM